MRRRLPVSALESGIVGHWDADYRAATGCIGSTFSSRQPLDSGEIGVAEVGGNPCHEIFPLRELYEELLDELTPPQPRQTSFLAQLGPSVPANEGGAS